MRAFRLKLVALFLFTTSVSFYHEYHIGHFTNTINIDGIGYNAYLPALFIYHADFNWDFKDSSLKNIPAYQNRVQEFTKEVHGGEEINKYSLGLAIACLPCWFGARLFCALEGVNASGYEMPFQVASWWNNLFWLFIGLYLFSIILYKQKFTVAWIMIINVILIFGTNVFHFITFDNSITHPVTLGFSFIAIYFIYKFHEQKKYKYFLFFCAIFSLIVLIRPFNVLMLPLFYFVSPSVASWRFIFKRDVLLYAGTIFGSAMSLYFYIIYLQTGHFFVYPYQNESFQFSEFHLLDILGGFKCGLFLYTPAVLLVMWILWKSQQIRAVKLSFIVYFLLIAYAISAWGEYCYGCRLGNRPFVDYYGMLLIPLLWMKPNPLFVGRKWLFFPLFVLLYYNQILHYQYRHYIMDWCDMNKTKFIQSFMKTHK